MSFLHHFGFHIFFCKNQNYYYFSIISLTLSCAQKVLFLLLKIIEKKNYLIHKLFSIVVHISTPIDPPAIPTKSVEEKLIDFGGSDPAISDDSSTNFNNNFISNNNLATANLNNNNNLVAALENNDERGNFCSNSCFSSDNQH